MLWFTALTSIVAGLLFGLAPALRATRLSPMAALKADGREAGERQFRTGQVLPAAPPSAARPTERGSDP